MLVAVVGEMSVASRGLIIPVSVPSMIAVLVLSTNGPRRLADLCVRYGRSEPLARSGDLTAAAEILIENALAQRQPAPLAVAINSFSGHSGHRRFLSVLGRSGD
ncbi:MAG: hypothetical protein ACLP01_08975 [Solirubrobacteraceae bacterium]